MRHSFLAGAIACALLGGAPALAASPAATKQLESQQTYIVRFDDAPLASYRGPGGNQHLKARAPQATSPSVTGAARLDLNGAAERAYRDYLGERRADILAAAARNLGRPLQAGFEFDVAFNGVTLSLSETEAAKLAALPGVAAIEKETISYPQTDAGPIWIEASQLWDGGLGGTSRGEGVVVGVVDSGINATHSSFAAVGPVDGYQHVNPRGRVYGLCLTTPSLCNDKLIGIHDFTICTGTHASTSCDDREPNTGANPDTHGSHVAATAVGNTVRSSISLPTGSVSRTLSGVAPHANLIAYKVCEDEESCRGSWVLAGINQAVADGVNVINYSIGGDPRNPWTSSDAQAMLSARDTGIVVVVAAGNNGPGVSTVTSPANSPWVLGVANATHDRVIANRLLELSGGDTAPPSGGVLLGQGLTGGYGPANLVAPSDFPLCSTGTNLDSPPTGVSNPWQAGRFGGEIVVCLRGTQARVAKSNNVRLAGGGGFVLLNQAVEGESTVADSHSIPGTHLGFSDGTLLRQWLASGSGHRGRIEGAQLRLESTLADRLASSSGRGPVTAGAYLKPDLTAPGSSVLAASGTGTGFAFLSGTSMASPHVAGAAALLRALRPDWNVSTIETALRSTAVDTVTVNGVAASAFEGGSGRAALAAAHKAGLSFELSGSQLRAANPSVGGNPKTLNLPSLVDFSCFERCQYDRTVTDRRGGGRWRAEVSAEAGMQITVTPSDFTLAANASQALQFELDVRDSRLLGRYAHGRVKLQPLDAAGNPASTVAAASVPVTVFSSPGALPEKIQVSAPSDRGFADVTVAGLVALQDLAAASTALVRPDITQTLLTADPTPSEPYDSFGAGTLTRLVTVPASATPLPYRLTVHAESAMAPDIDLFVGLDANGDGLPAENEELCKSVSSASIEDCVLNVLSSTTASNRYWILVQSFTASSAVGDSVQLRVENVPMTTVNGPGLVVTGPASVNRLAAFSLRLGFDQPALLPGEEAVGFVTLNAGGASQPFALLPLKLQRAAATGNAAKVLAPGDSEHIRLAAGAASERLVIDVPANASSLSVQTTGSGEVDLYLARIDTPSGPGIATAPARESAQASARTPGANESLSLTAGNGLSAGRWYVTPVNTGTTVAEFDLQVGLQGGSSLAMPRAGAYFNPNRDGSGAFVFPAGGNLGFLWYTYLQDGTPTWYIASAPLPAANSVGWTASLFRARWNGAEAPLTAVGTVVISKRSDNDFQFGWNLDGDSGSERYQFIDGGGCAQQGGSAFDINGFWFNPSAPGYGYSVNAFPSVETNGAYFFDAAGIGRWALGSVSPFGGTTLNFDLRLGSCPGCAYTAPSVVTGIGTLVRSYSGTSAGQMNLDLQLPAPLSGRWQVNTAVQKITDATGCN